MTSFNLRLKMLSDWRIGSGVGRQGAVDGLVARDACGLPYVPSTTLRGIWRDAAEQLAYGLDEGADGAFTRLVNDLFGSQPAIDQGRGFDNCPVRALLTVTDARFPSRLGEFIKENKKKAAQAAFTFVKSGVAIDPVSGRARDDFLRFDEIARTGALLDATATIEEIGGNPEFNQIAQDFALAALRLVERLGGDRRRGAGRCQVDVIVNGKTPKAVIDDAVTALASRVERKAAVPRRTVPGDDAGGEVKYDAPPVDGGVYRLPLTITLTTPTTLIARVEGNVISTLDHVPGTMLIQAVANLLGAAKHGNLFAQALGAGRIRVLPAYPGRDGTRGVPLPIVLEQKKEWEKGDDVGPAVPSETGRASKRPPGRVRNRLYKESEPDAAQYKPLRSGYCLTTIEDTGGLRLVEAKKPTLRTHNAVEDQRQKPTEDAGGGVYVAEVLPPGTKLYSALIIDATLAGSFPGRLVPDPAALAGHAVPARLGRGKAAGFGAAMVEVGKPFLAPMPEAFKDRDLVLLVASDLVLPAGALAPLTDVLQDMLKEAGVEGTVCDVRSDLRFRRLDGWIAQWSLPRPTLTAVKAGSVIVVCNANASAEALDRLSAVGLGMRRGEGFGEITVDPPILRDNVQLNPQAEKGARRDDPEGSSKESDVFNAAGDLEKFLRGVEKVAVLGVVRTFAELAAADAGLRREFLGWTLGAEVKPPMSQLGNIRTRIDPRADEPDFRAAVDYLDKTKASARAKSWGGAIGTLRDLLKPPETSEGAIWTIFARASSAFGQALAQALIVSNEAAAKRTFARKATAEFLLAAIRQHKRASEGSQRETAPVSGEA
ncbi:RAMP superfamily CRISPR-associated protein [Blastochloris sulfoviridis]|nr:RAMP superfamily CRISPR-associated protein [Blastochloris sulfoviridis]